MDMQFQQNIELSQRQILSPMLRQSLQYLQMPITELAEYLQEQSLSNPLLEVDYAPGSDFALPISVVEGGRHTGRPPVAGGVSGGRILCQFPTGVLLRIPDGAGELYAAGGRDYPDGVLLPHRMPGFHRISEL